MISQQPSERDLIVLRAIKERDPDNKIGVRLLGELTDKLVLHHINLAE